jgi:6-phosphogluconolactonase (cycloisomerase 2 family)
MRKPAICCLLLLATVLLPSCGSSHGSRAAYVTIPAGSKVAAFNVDDKTGALSNVNESPFLTGHGPLDVIIHPSSKFLYILNSSDATISLFNINGDRSLTEVMPRVATGVTPSDMTINQAGSLLFVVNSGSRNVSVYSVDGGSGALTEIAGSPFDAGQASSRLVLAPSENFLYVMNANTNSISIYSVDSGGALTQLANSPVDVGFAPSGLAMNPAGTFLYVSFSAQNGINGFAVDQATGELTAISSVLFAAGTAPVGMVIDSTGKFLYVANFGSDNVSGYTLDPTAGTPTQILATASQAGSPFGVGKGPTFVKIDDTGPFVYVGNFTSGTISGFTMDTTTGILTAIDSSPFTTNGSPSSMAIQ